MMKESRQRQLLGGQTSVAVKVFESVPIQEAWAENDIIKSMRTSGVTVSAHTVRACLLDMVDVGLIKQRQGHFQRVPVQPCLHLNAVPVETIRPLQAEEPAMSANKIQAQAPSPLDLLGTVATELVLLSSEFAGRMKALAARVEDVALSVAAQREADAAIIAQANQLKLLLKGFGE